MSRKLVTCLLIVALVIGACVPAEMASTSVPAMATPEAMATLELTATPEAMATPKAVATPKITVTPEALEVEELVGYRLNGLDGSAQIIVLIVYVPYFDWSDLKDGGVLCTNQLPSVTVRAISSELCGHVHAAPGRVMFGITTTTPHDVAEFDITWDSLMGHGLFWTQCQNGTGWYDPDYDREANICQSVEEILR